jgi:hypothetical protein
MSADKTQAQYFQIEDNAVNDAKVSDTANIDQNKIYNLPSDLNAKLNKSGGTMTGFLTTAADPVDDLEIANKHYVDSQLGILGAGQDLLILSSGLKMTWLSNAQISVSAGAALDSTGSGLIILLSDTIMDITTVGINGRDTTDPITQNTFHYIHIIGDSTDNNPTGLIFSTTTVTPTLPSGYDVFRPIGFIRITGPKTGLGYSRSTYPQPHGSIQRFDYIGNGSLRKVLYEDFLAVDISMSWYLNEVVPYYYSGFIPPGSLGWQTFSDWNQNIPKEFTRNVIFNIGLSTGNSPFYFESHIREPGTNSTEGEYAFLITGANRANGSGAVTGEFTTDINGNIEVRDVFYPSFPFFRGHYFEI